VRPILAAPLRESRRRSRTVLDSKSAL